MSIEFNVLHLGDLFSENTLNTCIKVAMISQDIFQILSLACLFFEIIQTVKELSLLF